MRKLILVAVMALLAAPATASAKTTVHLNAGNWDAAAQRQVVANGLMSGAPGSGFQGAEALSASAAAEALQGLAALQHLAPISFNASLPLSVTRFDALLVDQVGLGEVAEHVERVAQQASLQPPSYFGSEVVARYLGLRYEHQVGEQSLDLYPWNPITRAEAAYSLASVAAPNSWQIQAARVQLGAFALPSYSSTQLQVLRIAVSKIGMPYVWGGTTDGTEDGLEHGGYDCSGFAWRVYKVSGLSWGAKILGRTAAEQAGEIPRSQRIRRPAVQGGDLLFFGSAHFNSKATEANVIHEGIALSNEWVIHSSGQGVYVEPLTSGWLAETFTWARRVL